MRYAPGTKSGRKSQSFEFDFEKLVALHLVINILSINEKLPVSNFQYFRKYIIQLFGYCYVHVSSQRQAGLER